MAGAGGAPAFASSARQPAPTQETISLLDKKGLAISGSMNQRHHAWIAPLTAQRLLIMLDGQSLSTGTQAGAALSTVARPDCFMIGLSVRPEDANTPYFHPQGGGALHPLIGTIELNNNGAHRVPFTPSQAAALLPSDLAEGENPVVATTNHIAREWAAAGSRPPPREWVAVSTGAGAATLEMISKGATPALYQRGIDAVKLHKSLADAAGKSSAVAADLFMQGESNYKSPDRSEATKGGYKAKLKRYRLDRAADIMAITGQSAPPAFLTYQTSGEWGKDDVHLSVGMAQWEMARETLGAWMVGPTYPYTDVGGHLDANGYRWFGALMGKVAARVLVDGLDWEPLGPLWIIASSNTVYVGLHVPVPPIQFKQPYTGSVAVDAPDRGFRVQDGAGFANVGAVEIVGATILKITCDREVDQATAFVWAGDSTIHGGLTCVCDSDPTVADDLYTYTPNIGQAAMTNIPALVNKPYPLNNWLINFYLPVGFAREPRR